MISQRFSGLRKFVYVGGIGTFNGDIVIQIYQ